MWIWTVPAYMYAGGVGGAAAVLAAFCRAAGLDTLARRARLLAAASQAAGVPLLIADLGRPERFLNMLRVFRPTSPLSVGSWVLAASVPSAAAAAVFEGSAAGDVAGSAAAVLGLPLAAYPAVLLAGTAIPAWQRAGRALPVAFVGGAVSGAASLLELMASDERSERAVRRYGIVGKSAELAGLFVLRRGDGSYRKGVGGASLALSGAFTAASLVASLTRHRRGAGVLGTIGSVALRVGVLRAGWASARAARPAD